MINEREVDEVKGTVKRSGTGAHIVLPRDWIGSFVRVVRLYVPNKVSKK